MTWFEHSDCSIYYEDAGNGEPILLLPGWGGSIQQFEPLRSLLASIHRVFAADLPGSGQSKPQPRHYEAGYLQTDAEAICALIESLKVGPLTLIGFSDGGEVALLVAEQRPDLVRAIATWGALGKIVEPPGMFDAMANLIDAPIPPLEGFAAYMKATYGEENARVMTRSLAEAMRGMVASGGDISWSRASEIRCPVLLIAGQHDFLATPTLVEELAERIEGGCFLLAEGAGHDVYGERPEWLQETLQTWLSSTLVMPHQ